MYCMILNGIQYMNQNENYFIDPWRDILLLLTTGMDEYYGYIYGYIILIQWFIAADLTSSHLKMVAMNAFGENQLTKQNLHNNVFRND